MDSNKSNYIHIPQMLLQMTPKERRAETQQSSPTFPGPGPTQVQTS